MAQNQKDNGNKHSNFGLLVGLLAIAFIVLKLRGVINWSWWWVLLPLWIYAIFILVVGILIGIIDVGIEIRKRKDFQARADRYKNLIERGKHDDV